MVRNSEVNTQSMTGSPLIAPMEGMLEQEERWVSKEEQEASLRRAGDLGGRLRANVNS